jgi:hypothetical protein
LKKSGLTASASEQGSRVHGAVGQTAPSPGIAKASRATGAADARDEEEKNRVGRRARPPTLLQLVRCTRDSPVGSDFCFRGSAHGPFVGWSQPTSSGLAGGRLLAGAKSANGRHFDAYRIAMAERHSTGRTTGRQPLFVHFDHLVGCRSECCSPISLRRQSE